MKPKFIVPIATTAVIGLLVSGCSVSSEPTGNTPGVTEDTIHIGSLTDLSGPFSAGGRVQTSATKAYWADVNAAGGVCGLQVELNAQDHGYDPQKAVSQYRAMANNIIAVQQILGTPTVLAVLPALTETSTYTGGIGWSSVGLGNEVAQVPGGPYPIDVANAIDYMASELGVAKGSTIGSVYLTGDIAPDVHLALDAAGATNDFDFVTHEIAPPDTDFSAIVSSLLQNEAEAVILSVSPAQFGGIVNQLRASGMKGPIFGQHFSWNPAVLEGIAAEVIEDNVYVVSPVAPYASDLPGVKEAVQSYEKADPDGQKDWGAIYGYGIADLMRQSLEAACDDLTREGLVKAMRSQTKIDTGGIFVGELNFEDPFKSPTMSSYVAEIDAGVPGGLDLIGAYEGASVKNIAFPSGP